MHYSISPMLLVETNDMQTSDTRHLLRGLLGWLGITFVAAALGAIASTQAGEFYAQLERPAWAPPGGVFAPVWSVLYLLMAIAAWRVWRTAGWQQGRGALQLFLLQLAFNALWSWLFFAWHLGAAAFVEVLLLWGLILATLIGFWRHDRLAAILLLPYLVWVSFAAVLNLAVWQANPGLL
jgi:tryptophan-rich sensory protein